VVIRSNLGFVPDGGFAPYFAAAMNPTIFGALTTNQPAPAPVYTPPPFLPEPVKQPMTTATEASSRATGPFGLPMPLVLGGLGVLGVGTYLLLRKRR